jgi:hypothetical protein
MKFGDLKAGSIFAGSLAGLSFGLMGCSSDPSLVNYERIPLTEATKSPASLEGRLFEIEGSPKLVGKINYTMSIPRSAPMGMPTEHIMQRVGFLYEVTPGVFAFSNSEINKAGAVRGQWQKNDHVDLCREQLNAVPTYYLNINEFLASESEWRKAL